MAALQAAFATKADGLLPSCKDCSSIASSSYQTVKPSSARWSTQTSQRTNLSTVKRDRRRTCCVPSSPWTNRSASEHGGCRVVCSSSVRDRRTVLTGTEKKNSSRETIRIALPSKGRMADDSLDLLKACQLSVRKVNPRQYIADIAEMEGVEVWFQRASDVVRKLCSGDIDLGIVGYDMVKEYGQDNPDLIVLHDSLGFGSCHLAIGVPVNGVFESVDDISQIAEMPEWTAENPLRIVTGYTYLGKQFLAEKGLKHCIISTADGALEAAPAMGTADAILDLVSSGTTLRENNLREIPGGTVLKSQGVLVGSRKALMERKGCLEIAREMLERLEAHMRAKNQFSVTTNMRGKSELEIAKKVLDKTNFPGLQGPTIAPVYVNGPAGESRVEYFAVTIILPKSRLYEGVQQLRAVGGSGVLVSPLTYIFDEEPPRWRQLLRTLGLES